MTRKLAFALSLLGVIFTGFVHALGLGEVSVKSSLNQPLVAEIELVNSAVLGAEEILPGLATREEFLKANVDRVYFLSDLRFKVDTNAKGELVVILTTTKPVREPFLNFLVEVIWPSGRLLREYALLIDPPVFTADKPAAVQTVQVKEVQPSQSYEQSQAMQIPVLQNRSVTNPDLASQSGTYGPTRSTDTLWDIAIKARPDRSVSPQQVMLAIQDLNPSAFIKANINKLKAGQVLRLPSLDQIRQRSKGGAIEQVIAQNEASRSKRTKSIASSTDRGEAAQLPATAKISDELKLVVASTQTSEALSANSGQSIDGSMNSSSSEALSITLEKLDKAKIDNTELNGRVTDLEEQLQTLQRLLTLKNDQLSNIQTQMRANEMAKNKAEQDSRDLTELSGAANDSLAIDQTSGQVDGAEDLTKLAGDEAGAVVVKNATSDQTVKPDEAPALLETDKTVTTADNAVVDATQDLQEEEAGNVIAVILNNPLYLTLAVAAVLILVIILWLVSRNNAKRELEYQALNPASDAESVDGEDEALVDDGFDVAPSDDFQADDAELDFEHSEDEQLEESDEDSSDDSENEDVIAEADVYIAYGRLDQAAAVLENAISADPVRTDFRLKLLAVYKDSHDVDSFNRQFSELEAIQDASALEEAGLIRSEMLDNELVSLEDKEHSLQQDRESEAELESRRKEEASIEVEEQALDNEGQSFDFDSVDTDEGEPEIDFSSEALGLDLDETDDLAADLGEDLLAGDLELDISTEDLDSGVLEGSGLADGLDESVLDEVVDELMPAMDESEDFDDAILDVDLDDIDLTGELDQETEISLPDELSDEAISGLSGSTESADSLINEDSAVSDAILEDAADEYENDQSMDDELADSEDFDFLDGTDEASTKLDLARAYIDMGDIDGAKDILEEVTKEGSEEQRIEARDLLGTLDT
jgi:pilus assembly protein FimV